MIDRPEIKNKRVFMPSGQEMFQWSDGIYRINPEQQKPSLNVVENLQPAQRNLTPIERGRYRTIGRILARLIAGKATDPRLIDKLIPDHAPKQVIRKSSQELIKIATEAGKPKEVQDKAQMRTSVDNFLQAVGIKTITVRRELATLQSEFSSTPSSSIADIESILKSLNDAFPPIVKLEGNGSSWVEPNPNRAYQIHRGELETRRNELRSQAKKKGK